MDQETLDPLISFTVMAKPSEEWGVDMVAELVEQIDKVVTSEQEDAFWVNVSIKQGKSLGILMDNDERFIAQVNKGLGQALIAWKVEAVYRQKNSQDRLVGLHLLMNTVSLQDIVSFGV